MTPTQSQLWQFMGQPVWRCTHLERLPLAPAPSVARAQVLIILGQGKRLPAQLKADLVTALSVTDADVQVMDESCWLAANKPSVPILLGLNLTDNVAPFDWHGSLPLAAEQKRSLWNTLCRLYFAH